MRVSVQIIAFLLLLAGAIARIISQHYVLAPYLFGAGAVLVVVLAVVDVWRHRGTAFREARLFRINLLASLALVIGAYLMYKESNSWVICLMIYALVTLFLSYRLK